MPLYTQIETDQALDVAPRTSLARTDVTAQSFGPGELSTWNCYVQGKNKCWTQKEARAARSKKPKILISHGLLDQRANRDTDLAFISALVENYDVYFWRGDDEPAPIRSSDEFLRLCGTITPATTESVKKSLSDRGRSAHEFRMLDFSAYELVQQSLESQPSGHLDLSRYNVTSEFFQKTLTQSLDAKEVSEVRVAFPDMQAIHLISQLFPQHIRINCVKSSSDWAWECKDLIRQAGLKIEVSSRKKNSEAFSLVRPNLSQKQLPPLPPGELVGLECQYAGELTGADHIGELLAVDERGVAFEKEEALHAFKISYQDNQINIPRSPDLKILVLGGGDIDGGIPFRFDFKLTPNLQKLTLRCFNNFSSINLGPASTHLYDLELTNEKASQPRPPSLASLTKLDKLRLKGFDLNEKSIFDSLAGLENLEIVSCNIRELHVPHGEKLRRLVITDCEQLATLDLRQFPNLEELCVTGTTSLTRLDLSCCRKLKRVRFDTSFPLDLTPLAQLELATIRGQVPDLSHCLALRNLTLENVPDLKHGLDLSKHAELESLSVRGEDLRSIRANGLAKLNTVSIGYFGTTGEDAHIELKDNPMLQNVDVRGGCDVHVNFSNSNQISSLALSGRRPLTAARRLASVFAQGLEDCRHLRYVNIESANRASLISVIRVQDDSTALDSHDVLVRNRQLNDSSPTSLCSYNDDARMDADTALDTRPKNYSSSFSLTLQEKNGVDRDRYRQQICEAFQYEEKGQKIAFSFAAKTADCQLCTHPSPLPLTQKKIDEVKHAVVQDEKEGAGFFTGKFVPGKLYSLATQHAMKPDSLTEIYSEPPDAIKIYYHDRHKQFYFEVPPGKTPAQEIKLLYRYQRNPLIAAPSVSDPEESKISLLPDGIRAALKAEIERKDSPLSFLADAKMPAREKLARLESYCKEFKNEGLTASPTNDLENLVATIREKKGACRHRSRAFMALAHYINVPVRMIVNEQHQYCEVPYLSGDQHRVDLGGAPIIDATPAGRRCNVFGSNAKNAKHAVRPPPPPAKKITPNQVYLKDLYTKEFKKISGVTTLDALGKLLKPHTLHPVLEVSSDEDIRLAKNQLIAELRKTDTPYLYIHNAEDLRQYFECYDFKEKKRMRSAGPLQKILREGGVLLINWANFSPAEIANFKSLIDRDDANLLNQHVSPQVHSVGFTKKNTVTCNAFLSRCKRYAMESASLLKGEKKQEKKESKNTPIVINLYHQKNWHDRFLGHVDSKEGLVFVEGALLQARREKRPLHIYNPPDDEEFNILLERVTSEGRLHIGSQEYDGFHDVPIKIEHHDIQGVPENIQLSVKESDAPSSRIYIGSHNWHELFKRSTVQKGQNTSLPGLLELTTKEEKKPVFYITNSIDQSDWQRLVDYAVNHLSDQFQFQLAPRVEIEKVAFNESKPTWSECHSFKLEVPSLIASNDPSLVCDDIVAERKDHPVKIVDLTPEMGYQNLIASEAKTQNDQTSQITFHYEEQFVLTALRKGETVVLKNVSLALYQRLLPLLSQPAYIESNGERIGVSGKLVCVMPEQTLQQFPFHPVHCRRYTDADYQARFKKDDHDHVQTIQAYFSWLNRLPQHKIRPQILSFARLKNMVSRLNNAALANIHSHNPVKEFFLEDYPKGEKGEDAKREDYSYMNVLGKYFFRSHDDMPYRQKKLNAIRRVADLTQISQIKNNLWRILNCFNGAELHRILGSDLTAAIEYDNGMPTLKQDALNNLRARLSVLETEYKEKKSESRRDKTNRHIQGFVNVGHSRILVFTGMPGRGKTFAVEELKAQGNLVYRGRDEKELINWLEHKKNHPHDVRPCYLELSEYNMTPEGTWDFLEGMMREPPKVIYQGVEYDLLPTQRIIATGNPPDFEGRQAHRLFQQHGVAVPFMMSENEFLDQHILQPRLQTRALSGVLLQAFELIKRHNPARYYSYRDLGNLAARVNLLTSAAWSPELIFQACVTEFASAISTKERREAFMSELRQLFSLSPSKINADDLIEVTSSWFVPREAEYAVNSIEQAFQMQKANLLGKQIILLEGDPGVGKSALIDAIAARENIPIRKINAGDGEAAKTALRAAFARRETISLEEFNLDEDKSLEELLIQLLEKEQQDVLAGIHPTQRTLIIASQNAAAEQGRASTSLAMQNRTHHVYLDTYSRKTLEAIAGRRGVEEPEVFVDVYLDTPKANMRMFYRYLDSFHARRVVESGKHFSKDIIVEFMGSVDEMKKYGKKLMSEGEKSLGKAACHLSSELKVMAKQFFKTYSQQTAPEAWIKTYDEFEKNVQVRLHSQESGFMTKREERCDKIVMALEKMHVRARQLKK
jgi:hypothetical protein